MSFQVRAIVTLIFAWPQNATEALSFAKAGHTVGCLRGNETGVHFWQGQPTTLEQDVQASNIEVLQKTSAWTIIDPTLDNAEVPDSMILNGLPYHAVNETSEMEVEWRSDELAVGFYNYQGITLKLLGEDITLTKITLDPPCNGCVSSKYEIITMRKVDENTLSVKVGRQRRELFVVSTDYIKSVLFASSKRSQARVHAVRQLLLAPASEYNVASLFVNGSFQCMNLAYKFAAPQVRSVRVETKDRTIILRNGKERKWQHSQLHLDGAQNMKLILDTQWPAGMPTKKPGFQALLLGTECKKEAILDGQPFITGCKTSNGSSFLARKYLVEPCENDRSCGFSSWCGESCVVCRDSFGCFCRDSEMTLETWCKKSGLEKEQITPDVAKNDTGPEYVMPAEEDSIETSWFLTSEAVYIIGGASAAGLVIIATIILIVICVCRRRQANNAQGRDVAGEEVELSDFFHYCEL